MLEVYILGACLCLLGVGVFLIRAAIRANSAPEKWAVLRMEHNGEWYPVCEVPTYSAGVKEVAVLRDTDRVMRLYSVERMP